MAGITEVKCNKVYALALLSIAMSAAPAESQTGSCTEDSIKKGNVAVAGDAFAYMPPYGKPVVGKQEIQAANTKSFSERTNITRAWVGEHRIAVAPSGDMAYEYGTLDLGYDSKSEGHQEFKAVMLVVYRAHDGVCQQVALTMQPIDGQ